MSAWRFDRSLVLAGAIVGFVFGAADMVLTRLNPLAQDTPRALLVFYGPVFSVWAVASLITARRAGRFSSSVVGGMTIAFATSCIFVLANLVRVNIFFDQLMSRADWQNMMMRFRTSGFGSPRLFVNFDYLRGAPFKIAVATAIGALMGIVGGAMWWVGRRITDAPYDPLHPT